MFFFEERSTPRDLLHRADNEEDISVVIGENGTGKSTLLHELSEHFLAKKDVTVIALANTIYDKFRSKNKNFYVLKSSVGKALARNTLANTFKYLSVRDLKRFGVIGETLKYVGFDPFFGIKIKNIKPNWRDIILDSDFSDALKNNLSEAL